MAGVTAEAVKRFMADSSGSGYGDGYGSGDGSGTGSGDGSGYGSGYGYGSGSGDGSGDGYGYGSGSGDGSGYGSGYGYGSGSGDGDGSGSGSGSGSGYGTNFGVTAFCGDAVQRIDGVSTIIRSIHGNIAMADILRGDLTLKKCYVAKGGNCFAHGETIREAQAALEAKIMENMPVEDRISKFIETFSRGEKYPAKQFYEWHNILTGSCEMGRNEFAREHGIDVDAASMTPEEFVELTENAYGGKIIKMLKDAMNAPETCEASSGSAAQESERFARAGRA